MRGAVPLVPIALGVGIVAVASIVYIVNPTVAEIEIGNETIKIGVKEVIDTIVNQFKPTPTYEHAYNNTELLDTAKQLEGKEPPKVLKDLTKTFDNSISLCFTKENTAHCVNISIVNNTIVVNKQPAKKTIYVDYELKDEILQSIESGNYNQFVKIVIGGIKSGKIRGISVQDLGQLMG